MTTLINTLLGVLLFLGGAVLFGIAFAVVPFLLTKNKNVGNVR